MTVDDIQDGDHVVVTIVTGAVVADGPVRVVRMFERDGPPKYAHLNVEQRHVGDYPVGYGGRGPLVRLDTPVVRGDGGTWLVRA